MQIQIVANKKKDKISLNTKIVSVELPIKSFGMSRNT